MPGEEDDKGFKVRDRRRFNESGEAREDESPPTGAASAAREAVAGGPVGPNPETEGLEPGPPGQPIDFTTFVFSLGSSALIHLGETPHPETGAIEPNLPLAHESIDLLALLQDKTKGNLTPEEDRFLGALLYDLRLRYVQRTARKPG